MRVNEVTDAILGAAIKVHSALGPGLLESVYEACLVHELRCRGHHVDVPKALAIHYDGLVLPAGLRLDMLVDDLVVVELKAVECVLEVHKAQVVSYLRLTGKPVGLLINFKVVRLKDGVIRLINRRTLSDSDSITTPGLSGSSGPSV